MNAGPGWSLLDYFAELPDPRVTRSRRPALLDLIPIALCAALCGADSRVPAELFGKSKREGFATFRKRPNGIPAHDTFGSVFSRRAPERFRDCFVAWPRALAQLLPGEVVAVAGQTARRSHARPAGQGAWPRVSPWAAGNGLTLGQVKPAAKSNEITASPRLPELPELKGRSVTIDARGGPPASAQAIVAREADCRLAVKENRPTRYADLPELFPDEAPAADYAPTRNQGAGQVERRERWTRTDPDRRAYWPERSSGPGRQAVVKGTGRLNLSGLAHTVADLTRRARQGQLTLADVQGGTFTLNNTGALGSTVSQPLINHPQAAILTTEAIQKRPVVLNDAIAIRSMMNLCLSFDHRINDGAEAGAFIQEVKTRLEAINPDAALS